MFKQGLFASSLIAASISTAMAVPYGFFDARSIAMGNTSVATGSMSSAAFSNPALLVNNVSDDSFIISLGAGAIGLDNGGVIDTVDGFQGIEDDFNPAITEMERLGRLAVDIKNVNFDTDPTGAFNLIQNLNNEFGDPNIDVSALDLSSSNDLDTLNTLATDIAGNVITAETSAADNLIALSNDQIDILNTLAGDSLLGTISPSLMLGYAGDAYSLALSAQVNVYLSGGLTDNLSIPSLPDATALIGEAESSTGDVSNLLGNPTGTFIAIGAVTTEVGVSIASKLTVAGMNMAVGVKPKIVSAKAIDYSANLEDFDTADIADSTAENLGSFTTFDAGITVDVSDSFRVGLMGMNLISNEFVLNSGFKVNVDTKLRIGAAYNNSFFTLTADMDLTETDPILFEDPSKMLAVGMEFNAFNFAQLRFGYQDNLASGATTDPLFSAGIGLWILGVDLQIAGVWNDDSLGAFVQTGLRF